MITNEYEKQFLLTKCQICGITIKDHARCAVCGILAGEKHIEIEVYPWRGKTICAACLERRGK